MLGEMSAAQIEAFLESQIAARIGCHAEGQTYVVRISYAYDGAALIAHSVPGRKLRMMRSSPEVCIEIDGMETLGNWKSVIAWGRFEELAGSEAAEARRFLLERFRPLMTTESRQPSHGIPARSSADSRAVFYRIRLHEKTGRFERRSQVQTELQGKLSEEY